MEEAYNVNLVLKMKNGMMTVVFMPVFDSKIEPAKKLVPLTVTERPEVLDQAFISVISTAIAKTNDFAESLKAYEKGLQGALAVAKKSTGEKNKPAETTRDERMGLKESPDHQSLKNAEPFDTSGEDAEEAIEPMVNVNKETGEIDDPEAENLIEQEMTNEEEESKSEAEYNPEEEEW